MPGARFAGLWQASRSRNFRTRDLNEGIIESAAAAPVGGFFGSYAVDRSLVPSSIDESSEWHPHDSGADAIGDPAHSRDCTEFIRYIDGFAVPEPTLPSIVGVNLNE